MIWKLRRLENIRCQAHIIFFLYKSLIYFINLSKIGTHSNDFFFEITLIFILEIL